MVKILGTLFSWAKDIASLNAETRKIVRGTRGTKRMVLVELKHNLQLIMDHHGKHQIPFRKIVPLLELKELEKALKEGFDFRKIKKGKVSTKHLPKGSYYQRYLKYTCEDLFENVFTKVKNLKTLLQIDPKLENTQYRPNLRLQNLGKMYLFVLHFIRS